MTKHDNVSLGGIMKATEFVKKFGLDSLLIAKTLPKFNRYEYVIFYADEIDFSNEFLEKHKDYMFETQELKRLVESHELVERCGGLNSLKAWVKETKSKLSLATYFHCNKPLVLIQIEKAEQAIADVEACHEVN